MHKSSKLDFNVLFLLLSLIIVIFLKPNYLEPFDDSLNFSFALLVFINVMIFWSTTNSFFLSSWIRYDALFLLGFLIVHFQIPFLASLGIQPENPDFIWININVANYATWMSTIALFLWQIGFLLQSKKELNNLNQQFIKYKVDSSKLDFLLLVFFVIFISLVGSEFLRGSYNGTENWGEGATYAYLLLSITLYLKIIYFFINSAEINFNKSNFVSLLIKNKVFVFILIFYLSIFLVAGDRGTIMEIAILIMAGYSIYQKKIRFVVFIFMTFATAFMFTIISLGRTDDAINRKGNVFESGYENFNSTRGGFNPTDELASTNRILYRALDVVPFSHPYLYGLTFYGDIIGVVPFAGGIYQKAIDLPDMYKSSSYFFTVLGQGKYYSSGEGSEILADIYINFGLYGVFILMFFFGYFVSYLTFRATIYKDHKTVLIYMLLLMGAIYINRSNFLDPIKIIFYGLLFDKFLTKRIFFKNN